MPGDLGPCQTCPRATGVLAAPTGLYHTCPPDEWQVCNVLYRASMPAATDGRVHRTLHHRARTLRSSFTYLLNRMGPLSGSSKGSDE